MVKKLGYIFQPIAQERHQGPAGARKEKKTSVTNELSARPSALIREEAFAKQLRLARYLAAGVSPPSRSLEPVRQPRTPKRERTVAKAKPKTKTETAGKKAREEELAKERRRAGRVGQKVSSAGSGQREKQRPEPGR